MSDMIFIVCKQCKTKISSILIHTENERTWNDYRDYTGVDFVDNGFYFSEKQA